MSERIKVAEYQKRPIEEIEFPDGSVWTLRQPLEEDYYRRQEVIEGHMARVRTKAADLAARATAKAEETGADDEARALIDEEADEETLAIELTLRYMQASVLAIFITPTQGPKVILETLPPDLMHYLLARVDETLGGDAAKKRVRSETR
ncbi:MAG: hypothetical protein V1912_00105 [bacterium]